MEDNKQITQSTVTTDVDKNEVVKAIPFNRNTWHCGDGNGDGNRRVKKRVRTI